MLAWPCLQILVVTKIKFLFEIAGEELRTSSETWEPAQFWKKRSRSEKAILGATRNSGVFSEQLSEWLSQPNLCENPILGATLGATLGIGWTPKFQPQFSERFFQNWGGPRAPDKCLRKMSRLEILATWYRTPNRGIPEKCWRGWHKCWQKRGCWLEVLVGCFMPAFPQSPACQHSCQHVRHPHFCTHLCQHPRQHFPGIPRFGALCQVARISSLDSWAELYHWERNYYILYSEKIKSSKETGSHYSN